MGDHRLPAPGHPGISPLKVTLRKSMYHLLPLLGMGLHFCIEGESRRIGWKCLDWVFRLSIFRGFELLCICTPDIKLSQVIQLGIFMTI